MEADARPGDPNAPFLIPVFGYDRIVAGLDRVAGTGRAGQAYLISGPPSAGKRTLARRFAQALVCTAPPDARPCGACRNCRQVAHATSPDVLVAPSPLRIEEARELQHAIALAPAASAHRVAIVPEIELASPGAANSLLKTLEEPPPHAVLLLTTAQLADVLPTIRSRCQVVGLPPPSIRAVAGALETAWGVPLDRAEWLARLSGGRLGWAVRAHTDPAFLESRTAWLDGLARALAADRSGRMTLAARLAGSGEGLAGGLIFWSGWWRDLLLVHHAVTGPLVNADRLAELETAAGRYGIADAVSGLRAVEAALRRLAAHASPQLTLEVLHLDLPA